MGCVICGKDVEKFRLYVLSLSALRQFFSLMGNSQKALFCQEVSSNQPLHVCNECLKFE